MRSPSILSVVTSDTVILPLFVHVSVRVWIFSDLLVARDFFLNDIYVFSITMNSKVDEILEILGVMMEGVVEVELVLDKEVDEDV